MAEGGGGPGRARGPGIIGRGTWIDKLAAEMLRREEMLGRSTGMIRVESGLGASGIPHLGSLGDAVRAYGVKLAVEDTGRRSELIAYSDDLDGLRKVPDGMPGRLAEHIAKPVSLVPDPYGECHASYGAHMSALLLEGLDRLGIKYTFKSARESYAGGAFRGQIAAILSAAERIGGQIERMVGQSKFRGALPYFPVCHACQRLYTARAVSFDPDAGAVSYECVGADIGGSRVGGCGHAGESDIARDLGKLAWKVEFAARWQAFDIRFEAYGKDIMDSVRVNDWVCENVLGSAPPHHARYEMLLDKGGRKISKSSGNVLTAQKWLRYAAPESILLLLYKRITGAREVGLEDVPALMDEYADLRARCGGGGGAGDAASPKERGLLEYVHLLDGRPARPAGPQPRYGMVVDLCRTYRNSERRAEAVLGKLAEYGAIGGGAEAAAGVAGLVEMAARYADEVAAAAGGGGGAAAGARGAGGRERPAPEMPDSVRRALSDFADFLGRVPAGGGGGGGGGEGKAAESIQGEAFACARRRGARPGDMFAALYGIVLGERRGPRIGPLVADMGPARVGEMIRESIADGP